jgi:hypothetical protein
MSQQRRSTSSTPGRLLLGLFLLGLILAAFAALLWLLWLGFRDLSPQVAAAAIAGSVTAIVSVASLILSRQWERRREIEQEHRRQKIPVYEEFIKFIFRVVMSGKPNSPAMSESDMISAIMSFSQSLIVWGADDVIRDYAQFRRMSASAGQPGAPVPMLLAVERLLLSIRKDIGHSNKGLKAGDLLSLFINDIEQVLQTVGEQADAGSKN